MLVVCNKGSTISNCETYLGWPGPRSEMGKRCYLRLQLPEYPSQHDFGCRRSKSNFPISPPLLYKGKVPKGKWEAGLLQDPLLKNHPSLQVGTIQAMQAQGIGWVLHPAPLVAFCCALTKCSQYGIYGDQLMIHGVGRLDVVTVCLVRWGAACGCGVLKGWGGEWITGEFPPPTHSPLRWRSTLLADLSHPLCLHGEKSEGRPVFGTEQGCVCRSAVTGLGDRARQCGDCRRRQLPQIQQPKKSIFSKFGCSVHVRHGTFYSWVSRRRHGFTNLKHTSPLPFLLSQQALSPGRKHSAEMQYAGFPVDCGHKGPTCKRSSIALFILTTALFFFHLNFIKAVSFCSVLNFSLAFVLNFSDSHPWP